VGCLWPLPLFVYQKKERKMRLLLIMFIVLVASLGVSLVMGDAFFAGTSLVMILLVGTALLAVWRALAKEGSKVW
jgi:peptidoglycan/LPS O-acetylase OafA/YrhL